MINLLEGGPVHPLKRHFSNGFSTPRLRVQPYKNGDAGMMGSGFDSPCVWKYSRNVENPLAAERWLGRTLEDPSSAAFSVWLRGADDLVGFCLLTRWSARALEVGGWLSFRCWGQGLAKELLGEILCCTAAYPLVAEVDPANLGALHLLRASGFVLSEPPGIWRMDR